MPRKSPKRRRKRSKRRRKSPKKRSKRRRKFKMQSQTYNRADFKEGDKFEKITWHYLGARNDEKGAYVDRKNKLYPWYPRVISIHPSYIYVFISVRPNRYARIYYNLIKDVVWEGGIVKSAPKRPKSAMKKSGGRAKRRSPRKKARSPRKKPSSPRKVKAAKKIQKYVRKRSGRRKNKFKMQEFIRWRSKPRSREIEERKYPIGRWSYHLKDETRVFRDELGRNFNKGDFRIGDVIEAINIDGRRPLHDCSILSSNDNELALLADRRGEYHGKNRYIVSYDDIREVIFRKSPKRPKSAMKKSGGRAKRRSPRKKARSPRKKPSSPRKVKAAKKIQKYVRKRSGRRKNKFKMQGQNLVRVFRDDLGRDFNKTDFYKNQDLEVIDSIYFWPQWSVRVKSLEDNNLEIYTELGEVLLIPYASIREVIYKQSPKRPKSAMKKGRKYKMQDDAEYVTITVNDLDRNFNKDDFYVGQIVDIRRNGRGWSGYKHKIKNIDNSGVDWSLMEAINGHESSTNYNSINSVRYYKEKKRPKSAMKKGRKYKMQGAAGGVTVTVNELGRDFNKDDFKVGQKIDIRRKLRSSALLSSGIPSGQVWGVDWWLHTLTVVSVENSKLSCTRGNRARELERLVAAAFEQEVGRREMKIDYNSIHSVRYHEMPKRPKSAMKTGRKYKMQNNARSGVVTVNELGRNFNKDDFKVGQKIDIRQKLGGVGGRSMGVGGWWMKNLTILRVENSKLFWQRAAPPWPQYAVTNINSIHSVKYPKIPKRPKSAMKKGGGQVKRKSPSKKARSPRKKPLSPRKVKAAKKIQKYVRKRSGRRKNKFKMQNNARSGVVTVNELGRNFNKDDFKVGQKIDIRRKLGGVGGRSMGVGGLWTKNLTVLHIGNSKLGAPRYSPWFAYEIYYNSIHSVKYPKRPKRPKSAMKKGGGQVKRKSPGKKARSPRKKPLSPRKVKAAKKIQKYVRKRSGRRKNKFKMQNNANYVTVTVDELGRDFGLFGLFGYFTE